MSTGWIALHRRLLEHPRFRDPEWLSVWLFLLLNATHQPRKMNFDGKLVELKPGQLITGRHAIGKATGVSSAKVWRILETMKFDQQIEQQAGVKGSIFTVQNWQEYQNCEQQSEQRLSSDRAATEQLLSTNNNGTTEQQNKETTHRAKPSEQDVLVYCSEIGLPEPEARKYLDYYTANGWRVGRNPMRDWKAALRNWRRNYNEGKSGKNHDNQRTGRVTAPPGKYATATAGES